MGDASPLRIATVILGLIVVCIGYYSFSNSIWYNGKSDTKGIGRSGDGSYNTDPSGRQYLVGDAEDPGVYKNLCPQLNALNKALKKDKNCPAIELEFFYITVIIICLVLSVILLIASYFIQLSAEPFKLIDLVYHGVAAVMLVIAAICYIVSAYQIEDALDLPITPKSVKDRLLTTEKYIAGILTLIQGIVYAGVAYSIS